MLRARRPFGVMSVTLYGGVFALMVDVACSAFDGGNTAAPQVPDATVGDDSATGLPDDAGASAIDATTLDRDGQADRAFRYVFISSQLHSGRFSVTLDGGLTAADAFCKNVADSSSTPGLRGLTWRAWLSSQAAGISAPQRISTDAGRASHDYQLHDGAKVFRKDFDFTVAGGIPIGTLITIDERGSSVDASTKVWTGTNQDGTIAINNTCADWTDEASANALTGFAFDTSQWCGATNGAVERECTRPHALYCFEAP